jgi:hypothetical protein
MTDPTTAALYARLTEKRFTEQQIITDHTDTDDTTTTGR